MSKFLVYAKSIVAAIVALIVTVYIAVQDKAITNEEWVAIGAAWTTVAGVFAVPNKPAPEV